MPGVLVSADGEITPRGKTPLTLINGRVSGITGVDRSAQLQRIPASSIDRIEINNNSSAKYDAHAEGGIINIILKKMRIAVRTERLQSGQVLVTGTALVHQFSTPHLSDHLHTFLS